MEHEDYKETVELFDKFFTAALAGVSADTEISSASIVSEARAIAELAIKEREKWLSSL